MEKTERWIYFDTGPASAGWNMACDEVLWRQSGQEGSSPALRTYEWSHPALSIGYSQKWSSGLGVGRDLVRRFTGGGLVEHGDGFTYSVFLPKTHSLAALPIAEIYRTLHEGVREALLVSGTDSTLHPLRSSLHAPRTEPIAHCFPCPSQYDLLVDGLKVAGAAIRKGRESVLIQGEIKIRGLGLRNAFAKMFGAKFEKITLNPEQLSEIGSLAREKYESEPWTKRYL